MSGTGPKKEKKPGLRLVSRKSTKRLLGKWKKLDSNDKQDETLDKEPETSSQLVLGVPLREATKVDPSLDGLPLPASFRLAIDYLEARGLNYEGIYRLSSSISRLDELERVANAGGALHFYDPHEAAGFIKRFLRKLPERVVPSELEVLTELCECDRLSTCSCKCMQTVRAKMESLEKDRYLLLAYVFLHAQHVVALQSENKMGVHALGLLLQTVLELNRNAVCYFLMNASSCLARPSVNSQEFLFGDTTIIPYVPPKDPIEIESWSCHDQALIEVELRKQNMLLQHLHTQIADYRERGVNAAALDERSWGVQTAITALKRRLKAVAEPTVTEAASADKQRLHKELYEEKQLMAVQCMIREDIAAEERRIALLDLKLNNRPPLLSSQTALKSPDETLSDKCALKEAARLSLVEELVQLRETCAALRARIELQSHVAEPRF